MLRIGKLLLGAIASLTFIASVGFGRGDGTLPLRLPGDGTLPLLVGKSFDLASSTGAPAATEVRFSTLDTRPLPANAAAPACRMTGANVFKHRAQGSLKLGAQVLSIQGICHNDLSQDIEIIAVQGQSAASMVGPLQPGSDLSRFEGRLVLSGAGQNGRYRVDLRDPRE